MKVKTLKDKGYFRLVCDDKEINEKYDCSQESPILLAVLSTWEDSQCWEIRDIRLEDSCYPSPYLEGYNLQKHMPVSKKDATRLKSQLKYYKEMPDGEIRWGTFRGIVGIGDKTDNPSNPSWIAKSVEGCWSFKAAQEKLKEMSEFWRNFHGDDLEEAMMENPNKQIDADIYRIKHNLIFKKQKLK